jgi:hypothetical protein
MQTTTARRRRASAILRVGCFGHFQSEDRICRSHCAVRIRCVIERDQRIYLELYAEMEEGDGQLLRLQ